jgi:hypothetical protein
MSILFNADKHHRQAKLTSGEIADYDMCSPNRHSETFDNPYFEYLGYGEIYMVDGKPQNSRRQVHFFKRNKV